MNKISSNNETEKEREDIDKITKTVAIIFSFVAVFYFFIKLIFL